MNQLISIKIKIIDKTNQMQLLSLLERENRFFKFNF